MTKICKQCGIEKDITEFYTRKESPDGHRSECKSCFLGNQKEHNSLPEIKIKKAKKHKEWYENNKVEVLQKQHLRRQENIEEIRDKDRERCSSPEYKAKKKEYDKRYLEENKDRISIRSKKYSTEHKEEIDARGRLWRAIPENAQKVRDRASKHIRKPETRKRRRERHAERVESDLQYHLSIVLRSRLTQSVKKNVKAGSAVDDLGCSIEELKAYLESKFKLGMTWENYGHGSGKWNIDHIMPLSAFDLTDRQHVLLACFYLNLQPLWHEENMAKNDSYPAFDWSTDNGKN